MPEAEQRAERDPAGALQEVSEQMRRMEEERAESVAFQATKQKLGL